MSMYDTCLKGRDGRALVARKFRKSNHHGRNKDAWLNQSGKVRSNRRCSKGKDPDQLRIRQFRRSGGHTDQTARLRADWDRRIDAWAEWTAKNSLRLTEDRYYISIDQECLRRFGSPADDSPENKGWFELNADIDWSTTAADLHDTNFEQPDLIDSRHDQQFDTEWWLEPVS